ncbi:MAG: NADP-dependent malic enzyme [Cyclobacteriaceae bacterium]|nr:NADP-dependent malic enzyme [Cyclobacteriaceae bacterium]
MKITKEDALQYHKNGRHGKIEVIASKSCTTQRDLALAYTPGVAHPCNAIYENPDAVFDYTAKGNLVAVISNGTAVLGLGNIGPLAGKPVMEGKAVLFKRFADVDVFDIEVNSQDPEDIIKLCKLLEPTFGGINLEDIKAPECFYIEETLKKELNIPVFHDDQHGTAIISGAGLLNALEIVGKKINEVRVVFNGAGAAGIACAEFYVKLGVERKNIMLCDSHGVIYAGRTENMNPYKEKFAVETNARTLEEAMKGADVFAGLSVKDAVTKKMVRSMADSPIIFAMANPDPEISYEDAKSVRDDLIMATGRSDYPNQVNNVLGFPFIFRGALDTGARSINEEMKMAATRALAALAKEDVPDSVIRAYGNEPIAFGPDYIIPKPFDQRVLLWEATAVARAAMETGVARKKIDIVAYRDQLEAKLGRSREIMRMVINRAKSNPKRIVFPEGDEAKILRASQIILDEGIGTPILLGHPQTIFEKKNNMHLELKGIEIVDIENSENGKNYAEQLYELRKRKGVTPVEAINLLKNRNYYGAMMVHMGDADGMVSGLTYHYPETIRPALQIIQMKPDVSRVSGLYIILTPDDVFFFADTTVNINPTAEQLVDIALCTADIARRFDIIPRIAMLSFSNFGSNPDELSRKVQKAVDMIHRDHPDLIVDGELQANTALDPVILNELYPFSRLKERANILIFPSLEAGNIAYKLVENIGKTEAIGPILMGLSKPVHVLQRGDEVNDIVNMAAIAVTDAQEINNNRKTKKKENKLLPVIP